MSEAYRGGNARLLARQLDQLLWPVVVLDQRLQIVFVSASLCRLLNVDASELVGLECVAELTKDESPEPELAMMLAPPADVLHGKAAFRQVPWPPRARTKSSSAPLNQPVNQPPTQPPGHAPAQPPTHSPSHGRLMRPLMRRGTRQTHRHHHPVMHPRAKRLQCRLHSQAVVMQPCLRARR